MPLPSDPHGALFAEQANHPKLHGIAKRLYEVLLTYATYRIRRQKMTEKQTALSDNNHTPIKQGLDLLLRDFGVKLNVEKNKTFKTSSGVQIQRRRCERVYLENEMACLIAKSLVSIGPGTKVPFSKLAEFKHHHDDEVSAEPSATVYQAALELDDVERMQVNHNGPKHLLPELYEELVDIEAISSAISEQKSMVEKLQTQIKEELEKSGKTRACGSMREDHKKAAPRLKQLEDVKGKARSTTQVQYYFGKMGFGRRYAYTRGKFSYQGASRLVRKILAGRFYTMT